MACDAEVKARAVGRDERVWSVRCLPCGSNGSGDETRQGCKAGSWCGRSGAASQLDTQPGHSTTWYGDACKPADLGRPWAPREAANGHRPDVGFGALRLRSLAKAYSLGWRAGRLEST
jgi:hypothetical protein